MSKFHALSIGSVMLFAITLTRTGPPQLPETITLAPFHLIAGVLLLFTGFILGRILL